MEFDGAVRQAVADSVGSGSDGEDRFDAATGQLGMIEVVAGGRREGSSSSALAAEWKDGYWACRRQADPGKHPLPMGTTVAIATSLQHRPGIAEQQLSRKLLANK